MSKKIRVAVVGLSVIGQFHTQDYLASPSVSEVILCELNSQRLNEIADKYGIEKRYTDYSEMIKKEKPDIVSLAVPNFLHCPMAIEAMENGCDVFCEKPIAKNAEEANRIVDVMNKTNRKFALGFNHRFFPECRAIKDLFDNGELGDIYYVRTVFNRTRGIPWSYPIANADKACGGGPIIDIAVHVLDRALWMCGYPEAESVLANTFSAIGPREAKNNGTGNYPIEDMGVAMVRMKNGAMVSVEASWASNNEDAIITQLYGTKGGVKLYLDMSDGLNKVTLFKERTASEVDVTALDVTPYTDGRLIRHAFVNAVINNTEVPCTANEGLALIKIIDAIYESARLGQAVDIK